jgi:hypothetical protein
VFMPMYFTARFTVLLEATNLIVIELSLWKVETVYWCSSPYYSFAVV